MAKRTGKSSKSDSVTRAEFYLKRHNRLRDDVLVALSQLHIGMFWPNETGAAYRNGQLVHYGCLGSSDIIGCIIGGYWAGFEIKTGNATLNDNQVRFKAAIEKWGGAYIEVHSVDEAVEAARKIAFRR